ESPEFGRLVYPSCHPAFAGRVSLRLPGSRGHLNSTSPWDPARSLSTHAHSSNATSNPQSVAASDTTEERPEECGVLGDEEPADGEPKRIDDLLVRVKREDDVAVAHMAHRSVADQIGCEGGGYETVAGGGTALAVAIALGEPKRIDRPVNA